MTLQTPQRLPLGKPLRKGQSEPQGLPLRKPLGLGVPYSLLLTPSSLLLTPPWLRTTEPHHDGHDSKGMR